MATCISRLPIQKLQNGACDIDNSGGTDPRKLRAALGDITGHTAIEKRAGTICVWLVVVTIFTATWAITAEIRAARITQELTEIKMIIDNHHGNESNNGGE